MHKIYHEKILKINFEGLYIPCALKQSLKVIVTLNDTKYKWINARKGRFLTQTKCWLWLKKLPRMQAPLKIITKKKIVIISLISLKIILIKYFIFLLHTSKKKKHKIYLKWHNNITTHVSCVLIFQTEHIFFSSFHYITLIIHFI